MKNNSIKFYKQAAKWIKTAGSPNYMQRGGLSIYDIPADYIRKHQDRNDPDNDLRAKAIEATDNLIQYIKYTDPYTFYNANLGDPGKRAELINQEFSRQLLESYDTEMRRDHYKKFDSDDALYDPAYQNASTNAFPDFVKNYDNPDFWVGDPEYDKKTIDDIIRRDMPDMTYVAPSQKTIDEQPEGYINRGFDLFATAANPSVVLHALNGRAASEAPNVNPKFWPKSFAAKGFDFWPMRDWSEGGPVDTQYQEARANNLRHWENTRNTFKPLEGETRLARAGDVGWRVGRLPIRALDWGFNKVLMPFASYQMTNEGIHRLRDAANSNGLLETGYNASVGALDTAAGVTLAADIANKSPFIYNMASKLGGMRYLRGVSPRVANMSRFLGEASGPLFAATVITDPVVEWADNTFRGLPAMEYAGNAKSEKLQRYSNAIQAINGINAADGKETPFYKNTLGAVARMRDSSRLPELKGRGGLLGPALKHTMTEGVAPEGEGYWSNVWQMLWGGDRTRPSVNPLGGYFIQRNFKEPKPTDGKFTGKIGRRYNSIMNSNPGMADYNVDGDDLVWVPKRGGGKTLVPGKLIYGDTITAINGTDKPTLNGFGTKWYIAPPIVGSMPENAPAVEQATHPDIREKQNKKNQGTQQTPQPHNDDWSLGSPVIPAI